MGLVPEIRDLQPTPRWWESVTDRDPRLPRSREGCSSSEMRVPGHRRGTGTAAGSPPHCVPKKEDGDRQRGSPELWPLELLDLRGEAVGTGLIGTRWIQFQRGARAHQGTPALGVLVPTESCSPSVPTHSASHTAISPQRLGKGWRGTWAPSFPDARWLRPSCAKAPHAQGL